MERALALRAAFRLPQIIDVQLTTYPNPLPERKPRTSPQCRIGTEQQDGFILRLSLSNLKSGLYAPNKLNRGSFFTAVLDDISSEWLPSPMFLVEAKPKTCLTPAPVPAGTVFVYHTLIRDKPRIPRWCCIRLQTEILCFRIQSSDSVSLQIEVT
jgi:hypothetical protein